MSAPTLEELKSVLESLKNIKYDSICRNYGFDLASVSKEDVISVVYLSTNIRESSSKILDGIDKSPLTSDEQISQAFQIISKYENLNSSFNQKKGITIDKLLNNFLDLQASLSGLSNIMVEVKGKINFKFASGFMLFSIQL